MRIIACGLVAFLLAVGGAVGWQQHRYLDLRRNVAQDRQPLLYDSDTFHVLTLVRLAPGADLIRELARTRAALEARGGGRWIYAGRRLFIGRHSAQLGELVWDAGVLIQYPSRAAYDAAASEADYASAWLRHAETYSHGMQRSAVLNLAVPVRYLGLRISSWIEGRPPIELLDTADPDTLAASGFEVVDDLHRYENEPVVVMNLSRRGEAGQGEEDRASGPEKVRLMAERGHGAMHLGRAVAVGGSARFDAIGLILYPSLDYLTRLLQSPLYQGGVPEKRRGDVLSISTVPILDQL